MQQKVVVVKDPLKKKDCNELENSVAEAQKFKRDALFEKENTGKYGEMIIFWPNGYVFIMQIKL